MTISHLAPIVPTGTDLCRRFSRLLFPMLAATINAMAPSQVAAQSFSTTGNTNSSRTPKSVLVAGTNNSIQRSVTAGFLGAGQRNSLHLRSSFAAIVGGSNNIIRSNSPYAFIGGGRINLIGPNSPYATVAGGLQNSATAAYTVVPGGYQNIASKNFGLAAGYRARAAHQSAFVWADSSLTNPFISTANHQFLIRARGGVGINTNNPQGNALFVNGSARITTNLAVNGNLAVSGTISGRLASATFSSLTVNGPILSGTGNTLSGPGAAIGGGLSNSATTNWATIAGGRLNAARGHTATIAGGENNQATGDYSAIGGGANNLSADAYSGVAAGQANHATGYYSFVGGGWQNHATTNWATISGGSQNHAGGDLSTIGGGFGNIITTNRSGTIGGGEGNTVTGNYATVGGGFDNGAIGTAAIVAGGDNNLASGDHATVPGGLNNEASGIGSFAAGVNAKATNDYSFVWGGDPHNDTVSAADSSFTVNAPGGSTFVTSTMGAQPVGVILAANATAWDTLSDSNAKTAVIPVDHRETLRKIAALPVTSWRYKHDPKRRYIGPMAQDFRAAFGLGHDDKHISTLDTDGVTLSAIKGLVEELRDQDQALEARDRQIEALESAVETMRESIADRSF